MSCSFLKCFRKPPLTLSLVLLRRGPRTDEMDAEISRGVTMLNGDNYHTWRHDIKVMLMDRGCYSFIDGTEPKFDAESMSRREIQDYNLRLARCFSTIYYSLEPQFRLLINDVGDGPTAWKVLKDTFEQVSRARVMQLMDEFFSIRPVEGESISIFCARLKSAVAQLADAGHPLENIYQGFQAIRYLSSDFQGIVQTIYRWEDSKFTFANIEKELVMEETRIAQLKRDTGDISEVRGAYSLNHKNIKNVNVSNDRFSKSVTKSKSQESKPENRGKKISSNSSKEIGPCFRCLEYGHLVSKCPDKSSVVVNKSKAEGNLVSYHFQNNTAESVSRQNAFVIERLACQVESQDKLNWVIDTAATGHFCNNRDLFLDYKPVKNASMSLAVNNAHSKIEGIGTVKFNVFIKGQKHEIFLHDCMYSPSLRRNLLSGSVVEENGCYFIGTQGRLLVYTPEGKQLFYGKRQDGLYFVRPKYENVSKVTVNVNKRGNAKSKPQGNIVNTKSNVRNNSVTVKDDINLWHHRYCHINHDYIVNTLKNDAVRGLPDLNATKSPCQSCKVAKTKQVSHKSIGGIRSTKPLELLHLDVCGPLPTQSHSGCRYFLSIIDDFSRKTTVFPMK